MIGRLDDGCVWPIIPIWLPISSPRFYPPTVTLTGLLHWPTRESPTR